jgi:hypothetical protein
MIEKRTNINNYFIFIHKCEEILKNWTKKIQINIERIVYVTFR